MSENLIVSLVFAAARRIGLEPARPGEHPKLSRETRAQERVRRMLRA